MGAEGKSFRVRCADLFAQPSDASSMRRRSPSQSPIFVTTRKPLQSPLEHVIEVEIGPRLLLVHHECPVAPPDRRPTPGECETLARLSIGTDEAALFGYFERVRAQDYNFATLLAFFIARAALHLGELWQQDLCDFFEVTLGVGRLQMLMNRLEPPGASRGKDGDRQALLIALPGETHILGLRMVGKLMDAVGWDVTFEEQRSVEENARSAAEKWIGVVGVTVGLPSGLERAARTIAAVRGASMNRNLAVLVGGNAFTDHPELVAQVGADAGGFDAPSAVVLASHLLTRQPPSR
jgi:MerR family transcriptional regulator, light-induced transcriptional regulator